ncbi:VOC family protein [Paenibacillus kobensis]|uniref:VOC family protein n=1 Tax=Paenibacillus kobensis TaxID=59841 RepID=UPI000FDB65E5|nr:VOC family protein [Paenibacillus kobensis]
MNTTAMTSSHVMNQEVLEVMASGHWMAQKNEEGYTLDSGEKLDNVYIVTPKAYKVPFRLEAVARTDTHNIRFMYGKAKLIFNWERDFDSLRANEPAKGKTCHSEGTGRVPVGEWVHFEWVVDPDYMAVRVNGEERLRVEGKFARVKGQAGIGPAFRSKVTVASFKVSGEETKPAPPKPIPMRYELDECMIFVPDEKHGEAVDWYCRNLRMVVQPNSMVSPIYPGFRGALVEFRGSQGTIGIVSVLKGHEHFRFEHGSSDGIRFNLGTGHLRATRHAFIERGIRTGKITTGENGTERFDFFDPYGNRLTAVQDARLDPTTSGIAGCMMPTVKVNDLKVSADWYKMCLQLKPNKRSQKERALLLDGYWRFNEAAEGVLWLEQQQEPMGEKPNAGNAARMYFYVEPRRFVDSFERLRRAGVSIHGLSNNTYHCFDPDGNQINVFSI